MLETDTTYFDMGFDFCPYFLQMLDDGAFNCSAEVGMLIGDGPRLVSDFVVNVLENC